MKTTISTLYLALLLLIINPVQTSAAIIDDAMKNLQNIAGRPEIGITITDNPDQDIAVVIGGIIQVVLAVLGIVFLALTVYGGWLWMTAAGNQDRVGRAKDLLRDSIIGLMVIIASYAITTFVINGILSATTG